MLDLEFFVGPRRDPAPVDQKRMVAAVETTERAIEASGATLPAADLARLQTAVYELIGREGRGAASVRQVIGLLARRKPD